MLSTMHRCKLTITTLSASVVFLFAAATGLMAQTTDALGAYSPYSIYGLGQVDMQGSSYNVAMGGLGIATRDFRYINTLNPAAFTARDTLAFMMDFGLYAKNNYLRDERTTAAYNVFNMQNVTISVPITRKNSALVVGISPFSNVGYKFMTKDRDPVLESSIGDIAYQEYGTGGVYQLFAGAAVRLFRHLSIGAQVNFYFGKIERHSDVVFGNTSYNSLYTGWKYRVNCITPKFGLQYEIPLKNPGSSIIVGATYRLGNEMWGDVYRYCIAGSDTTKYEPVRDVKPCMSSDFGVGFSVRPSIKWMIGFDYSYQDWSKWKAPQYDSEFVFDAKVSQQFRLGAEYRPNPNDVRYYMKRVSYRAGLYYDQSYLSLNGYRVVSTGLTLGASFPIYRYFNAISLAVDIGQRGSLKKDLVRETYVNFIININLHDIWFIKFQYD